MSPSLIELSPVKQAVAKMSKPSENGFHRLVNELSEVLGDSSGIDSDDVDVNKLKQLMLDYPSKYDDWKTYAFGDRSRAYTRNLVDEGNGKSNLLILCWTPGKGSPIHDHADAHCVMKILQGSLSETRYDFPKDNGKALEPVTETLYEENEVTYMADELGLHKISNPDPEIMAVSLHLYTPPNAAKEGCNIFDEKTGRRSHVCQNNFYSRFGCREGC